MSELLSDVEITGRRGRAENTLPEMQTFVQRQRTRPDIEFAEANDDEPARPRQRPRNKVDDTEPSRKKRRRKSANRYNVRNLIIGSIGVIWGLFIIVNAIMRRQNPAEGAYGAGVCGGQVLGGLMFVAGAYYVGREFWTGGTS